ncbi:MAG: LCP family protein, partial [Mycobacterium sp.]
MIRRDPNYRPPRRPPPPNPPTPSHRPPPPPPRRPPPPQARPPAPPPQARPPAPPKPKRPRRKRRWGRVLLALVFIVVVALVAGGLWMDSSLHRITALTEYPERPASGAGTTWLLVGSDSRENLTPEQQADLTTG